MRTPLSAFFTKGIAVLCGSLLAVSCASEADDPTKNNPLEPIELSRTEVEVSANVKNFSLDLLKATVDNSEDGKNVAVSPLGAAMVAGMFGNALAVEDRDELAAALRIETADLSALNSLNAKMLTSLPTHDKSAKLLLSNSSWFDQSCVQLNDAYRAILEETYSSEIYITDFTAPTTLEAINSWVSDRTDKAIPNILPQLSPFSRAVWLNVLYFKGAWTSKFDKSKTQEKNFILEDSTTTKVKMMTGAEKVYGTLIHKFINGYEGPMNGPNADPENILTTTMLTMDYGNGAFAFSAVMPDARITVKDFLAENSGNLINAISKPEIFGTPVTTTDVFFPKLSFSVETDLIEPMRALGANNVFDGVSMPGIGIVSTADSSKPMFINDFMQSIRLDVDEEGSEVKVVTIATGEAASGIPTVACFDHPFIYFIWEKTTGTILLAGTVMNPNE
ncbi:MAG: hypothetical protein K2M11_02375 [Paramuribaculum sp.]|nr:hypothetical protein [Paramuribaculum sp.]